jgi:predicted ATP-grasp superfamily ATP-dependent carboligase
MVILMIGLSVRGMVESAVNSGYRVIALDAFADRDTQTLTNAYSIVRDFHTSYSPETLLNASRHFAFDGIAYTANLENHPEVLESISQGHTIIGNTPSCIRSVRSWKDLFTDLGEAGFCVPEIVLATDTSRIDSCKQWLVKPLLGGGGHGIHFLRDGNLPGRHYFLQEYIPGKSCSASFLADGQHCVILGITEQLAGVPQFRSQGFQYCGSLLPLPEILNPEKGPGIYEEVCHIAEFLTQRYRLTGLNGMDFMLYGDQVYTIEVNPRYSASMELIEKAYHLPLFHLHEKAVLHRSLPEFQLKDYLHKSAFWGKAILFAHRSTNELDTQDWASRGIRDIPRQGERLQKGNPICTMLTVQPNASAAIEDLIAKAVLLEKEIYG